MNPLWENATVTFGAKSGIGRRHRWTGALPIALAFLPGLLSGVPCAAAQDATRLAIKQRVEQLREAGSLVIAGRTVHASTSLADLYEARSFAPLWGEPRQANDLLRAIRDVAADGLDPADYHLRGLETPATARPNPAAAADLELLRSDALVRLAHDLRYGKVDPELPGTRAGARLHSSGELMEAVQGILASGSVYEGIAALRPRHFLYRGLVASLAELRQIQAAGGWERIADGAALRLGMADPRIPALRRRLVRSGDLPASAVLADTQFGASLEAAVKRFQHRHGLNEDGVLGSATLAELNVPVEKRIEQLRVNLERARWFTHDLPETFVVVNIAGAKVYLVREGEVVLETRAIVGKTATRTPIFQASMRYIDLNPTWTVPPGIVPEVLAAIRRDPGYLRRLNMHVLDRSGRRVEVSASTLARYPAAGFPYVFQQQPGPANPLGRIKFVFPNSYNVYLHDTPSKSLFEREQRTFSHGCIRVQDPLRLAEAILNDPDRWSRATLGSAAESRKTQTIPLSSPLPVLVLYWTAAADLHGELHFYRDVYGRDAALLARLERR